jgi:hypothetical protein
LGNRNEPFLRVGQRSQGASGQRLQPEPRSDQQLPLPHREAGNVGGNREWASPQYAMVLGASTHSSACLSFVELLIISTSAGLFITAAGHVISGRQSVYFGADCFIPVRSVDVSERALCWLLPFDSRQLKRPANHPSFNEVFNLRSKGRRWLISSRGFRESSTSVSERLH